MFEDLLVNGILITFPFLIYTVYIATNSNITNREKEFLHIFFIVTSFLFLMRFGSDERLILILLNIPLYFAIESRHYLISAFLAITIILYHEINIFNLVVLSLNYIVIFIGSICFKKTNRYIHFFAIINCLSTILMTRRFYFGASLISFVLVLNIISFLYRKALSILKFYVEYKELQKEKQIRMSLFKITHEIKNPIAVCKAYLDMYDINDHEKSEKYLNILKSEVERLLCLLEDFALVNKSNVKCDIMDINLLLEEKLKNINELMNEKNINISYDLTDDEIYVMGDYNRLSQVMINLVKNSIEANPENIDISCDVKDKFIIISIKDDGEGINQEVLERIKEPFYTTKIKGSGLGVSLSNEIIEAHNGKLNYSSEYGKGTKVEVVLPLYEF